MQVARLKAQDDVVLLPVVSGKGSVAGRTRRNPAKAEIPLRNLHFLDDIVVKQGGKHVRVRAAEFLIGRSVAALSAERCFVIVRHCSQTSELSQRLRLFLNVTVRRSPLLPV